MPNQRRRGKSVVFDSLPSLVTAEGDDNFGLSRSAARFSDKMSREALQEIVMVLIGLVLVVWLFFGQSGSSSPSAHLAMGSKQILESDSMYILPTHFGLGSNARDGVKKAPGDKQGMKSLETTSSKRTSGAIYQYDRSDAPRLVVVTVIDDNKHPRDYIDKIVENRVEYAQRHHFGVLIKFVSEFSKFIDESYNFQSSWSRIALTMEAQVSFPAAEWIWHLSDTALIMEPEFNVLTNFLAPEELEPRMRRQIPVMRYSNTHIRTYKNNHVADVSYVFCQDTYAINTDSFFFRNNVASTVLLQLWAEPLYRSFQRFQNEEDALGHLLQWHTQFLVRTALVDAHSIGSLALVNDEAEEILEEVAYRAGDFVAIVSCDYATENCKREFQRKWNSRSRAARISGGSPGGAGAKDTVQNQVQMQAQEKAQEKAEKQIAEAEKGDALKQAP